MSVYRRFSKKEKESNFFISDLDISAFSLDEWDKVRQELNLCSVSSGDLSTTGTQTFSFSAPAEFELVYDPEDLLPEDELLLRGDTTTVCFKSVHDPTFRRDHDWCHVSFFGTVCVIIYLRFIYQFLKELCFFSEK